MDLKRFVQSANCNIVTGPHFSSSAVRQQMPDHPLYREIDWARVAQGEYAVIDPFDSSNVLYLTEREYKVQVRVSLRQDHTILVLAPPKSKPVVRQGDPANPTDPSSSSPHYTGAERRGERTRVFDFQASVDAFTGLLKERFLVAGSVLNNGGETLVCLTVGNLRGVLREWFFRTLLWGHGRLIPSARFPREKLSSYSRVRYKEFDSFTEHLVNILRHQGVRGVVLRLKSILYIVNRGLGGDPVNGSRFTGHPVKLDRGGFPLCLPLTLRSQMRSQIGKTTNMGLFRAWLSIFNAYKAMNMAGSVGLGSITNPPKFSEDSGILFKSLRSFSKDHFWPRIRQKGADRKPAPLKTEAIFLCTSGPNTKVSGQGRRLDAMAWVQWARDNKKLPTPLRWAEMMKDDALKEAFTTSLSEFNTWDKSLQQVVPAWKPTPGVSYSNYTTMSMETIGHLSRLRAEIDTFRSSLLKAYQASSHVLAREWAKAVKNSPNILRSISKSQIPLRPAEIEYADRLKATQNLLLNRSSIMPILPTGAVFPTHTGYVDEKTNEVDPESGSDLVLGRLSAKVEPAGKIRVFAIADYWTQRIGKPIHQWMEDLLRLLPADCTFDQDLGLRRFIQKGNKYIASFDLSSATDRIPRRLYFELFVESKTLGKATQTWLELLTDRWWRVDSSVAQEVPAKELWTGPSFVRYSTGQPMGAMSSWPSMALVHHFLILYCAHVCGHGGMDYDNYAILGDDITIGDRTVAKVYHDLCGSLGIQIKLAKSYESENSLCNFANQTYIGLTNISPLSLKEEINVTGLPSRLEMVTRIVSRWYSSFDPTSKLTVSTISRLLMVPFRYYCNLEFSKRHHRLDEALLVGLLGWFFPSERKFRDMGILNLSLKPLLWTLVTGKGVMGRMTSIRAGHLPNGASEGQLWWLWYTLYQELAEQARIKAAWIGTQFSKLNPAMRHFQDGIYIEEYFTKQIDEACFKAQMAWAVLDSVAIQLSDSKSLHCAVETLDGVERVFVKDGNLDEEALFAIIEVSWQQITAVPDWDLGSKALKAFAETTKRWSSINSLTLFSAFARGVGRFGILHEALTQVVPGLSMEALRPGDVPLSSFPSEAFATSEGESVFGQALSEMLLAQNFDEVFSEVGVKPDGPEFSLKDYFAEAHAQRFRRPIVTRMRSSAPVFK